MLAYKEQSNHIEPEIDVTPRMLVIGVGNDFRRDDAAGLLVARRLREQCGTISGRTEVQVLECTGNGLELIELWDGAKHVVLVDAVSSGTDPGTIFHLDAHTHPIPTSLFHFSTHGFNLADTIELARLLHKLPRRLMVFGVEGKEFGLGQGCTEDVEAAVEHTVQSLLDYVKCELEPASP